MSGKININKKAFLSLTLCLIMLFSVFAPIVSAETIVEDNIEEKVQKLQEDAKMYEQNNGITGKIIDFSNTAEYNFNNGKTVYGNLANDNYEIKKSGSNYTITLNNLIAKKIILPADDADLEKLTEGDIKYTGEPRKTHITIILNGTNKVTGYGIEGYPVKGIEVKGSGDLIVNAFSEPKVQRVSTPQGNNWIKKAELNYYTKAGISVETGDKKYEDKDKVDYADINSLVFASTGDITINAPNYYGVTNNGDVKFKSGNIKIESKKSAVNGYRIIVGDKENKEDKEFKFELISQEKAFYEKPTIEVNNHIIFASKSGADNADVKSKEDIENSYANYHYINAKFIYEENDPVILEDTVKQGGVYCSLPTITITDDTAIDTITVNGKKLTSGFVVNTAKKKIFTVPMVNSAQKEVVATDIFGNETKMSFTAHEYHQLSEPERTEEIAPTCDKDGSHIDVYTCTICHEVLRRTRVIDKALGHKFSDWETTVTSRKRTCSTCGYVEVEDLTKNINDTTVSLSTSKYVYDGNIKEPSVTVKDGTKELSEGKDYTVTYKNNLFAGTANVKVTGINKYKNTVSKDFIIEKSDNSITASNFTKNYSSKEYSFSIGAKQKGNGTLTYSSNNKNVKVDSSGKVTVAKGFVGKATITITASETLEYKSATKQITLTVNKIDNTITAYNFTKNYSSKEYSFSIGAKQKGNGTLTYSSNNKNVKVNNSGKITVAKGFVGKATITIKASETSAYKAATKQITVTAKKANNAITASNFTKTYSTKAQSFSINAKQLGNAKLTYSSNNKNVTVNSAGKVTIAKGFIGKVTITITANDTTKYNKATKKITVTVNPASVGVSKLTNSSSKSMTIKWNKSTVVTGYQIQYSTDKNFKKNVTTATITKNSTTSKTVSKLTKNKKYYVRIRTYKTVSGVKYYSGWSSSKNVTIKK